MRLPLRSVPLFCLLLACGDDDSEGSGGPPPDETEQDAGAPSREDGGRAGSLDAGRAAQEDAGRPDEVDDAADATVSPRDGGRRGGDASVPPGTTSDAGPASTPDLAQHCVDKINEYRATLKLAPLARAADKEMCVDEEAKADSISGKAHSAFGKCQESAQNECPGYSSKNMKSSLEGCLKQMWDEGPGDFNAGHGHYINMSSTKYKRVACGVHDMGNGKFWAIQNFF